jgi:hypothetical protein
MTKLWGIRHVRWVYLKWKLYCWVAQCASIGIGFHANRSDLDYLDAIWKGEV